MSNAYNIPEILAIVYAILMLLGYIPGLYTLVKEKDLTGVSNSFWFFIVITVGISFYNLVMTDALMFQVWSLGLNLLFGVICMFILIGKKKGFNGVLLGALFLVALFAFVKLFGGYPSFLQTLAHISIVLAYVGYINNQRIQKSTSGTNPWMFIIMGIGLSCLIISMIMTGTFFHVIITEALNLVLIAVCAWQVLYYGRK